MVVRAVIHPHAGGYIEFADEIEKVVRDVPYDTAGLCLDTGHLYYSQMDPAQWIKDNFEVIDFIHFKDINKNVYDKAIEEETDFFAAAEKGVMCPIGKGVVDYDAVKQVLIDVEYNGWVTLEQERDPKDHDKTLVDITKSLEYLNKVGFLGGI